MLHIHNTTPLRSSRPDFTATGVAVFLTAVIGWLPAFKAWWHGDDWHLLGRAAGLIETADAPARLVGRVLYWDVMFPLGGLSTMPYSLTRLLLHAGSALVVARLARRCRLSGTASLAAGLLFAASPLAFERLYVAAGVQQLLAAFFALAALEFWLSGGRRNAVLALATGLTSIMCWESALGLPALLAVLLWHRRNEIQRFPASVVIVLLATAALVEMKLVTDLLSSSAGPRPLALDDILSRLTAGGLLWVTWVAAATWRWRLGDRLAATALLGALLSVVPAILLKTAPDMYLVTAAGALTLASLLHAVPISSRNVTPKILLLTTLIAASCSWGYASLRLKSRDLSGVPTDRTVRLASTSFSTIRAIKNLPRKQLEDPQGGLIFLQLPPPGALAHLTDTIGDDWVGHTEVYEAIGGTLGPRLVLGRKVTTGWRNNLKRGSLTALVLVDAGPLPLHWGNAEQALVYVTLTHVARGRFSEARLHLLRLSLLAGESVSFLFDPGLMIVDPATVSTNAQAFLDYLDSPDKTTMEVRGLQINFVNLLRTVLGDDTTKQVLDDFELRR